MIVSESILRNKSKEFAKQIVYMCRDIKANARESVLTNQLLRSGTSIGANIHEAQIIEPEFIAGCVYNCMTDKLPIVNYSDSYLSLIHI